MRKLGALVLLASLATCQCWDPKAQSGTAVFLEVQFTAPIDQFEVTVDPLEMRAPERRPASPAGPLASPQTMRLLFADEAAGRPLTVRVVGLRDGVPTSEGEASATLQLGLEIDLSVVLAPRDDATDAGLDAGTDAGADAGLDAGCSAANCPSGCCNGSTCVTATDIGSCGFSGAACFSCDGVTANRCSDGQCRCGAGAKCQAGQRCFQNACVCDATSCPGGCCAGGVCQQGNQNNQCGVGGAACADCGADSCIAGRCSSCSAASCPNGCCSGASCNTAPTAGSCGGSGAACVPCSPQLADRCGQGGQCQCGSGPQCQPGQHCTAAGTCACDPTSCAGCCDGDVCRQAGNDAGACGLSGTSCFTCGAPSASACTNGACRCGSGPSCGAGQRCDGGTCGCDPATCTGCCSGNSCVQAGSTTAAACGGSGAACSACNTAKADNCANGTCRCGANTQCGNGLLCVNGACVCNTQSGCAGCCRNNQCLGGTSTNACGTAGAACTDCESPNIGNSCNSNGECRCGGNAACVAPQTCKQLLNLLFSCGN